MFRCRPRLDSDICLYSFVCVGMRMRLCARTWKCACGRERVWGESVRASVCERGRRRGDATLDRPGGVIYQSASAGGRGRALAGRVGTGEEGNDGLAQTRKLSITLTEPYCPCPTHTHTHIHTHTVLICVLGPCFITVSFLLKHHCCSLLLFLLVLLLFLARQTTLPLSSWDSGQSHCRRQIPPAIYVAIMSE